MEFKDDYEHPDPNVTYILENMKSREMEISVDHEICGCGCSNDCRLPDCSCLQRSGAKYTFEDQFLLKKYTIEITNQNKPVYECNNNCKCRKFCGNRLVQFGPRDNLKIISTPEKGLALITITSIENGNFICEYAGEVITEDEAQKRYHAYNEMNLQNNYVFCINEKFGRKIEKTFIDPTFYGNIGRYINHSCQPNSALVPIRIHDSLPRLCIFAKEFINENSEITFSYGFDGKSKRKCFCLSSNCRKFLPFDNAV